MNKKHKTFQFLQDWMSSLGGCFCLSITGHLLTIRKKKFFDDGQLIEMLCT